MKARGSYHSPLRESQTAATRERIVEACVALMQRGADLTYGAVAVAAGVQERTVYRHFPKKEDLEAALWDWIVAHLTHADFAARDEGQLVAAMRESFAGFDADAPLIQAMLHSPQGLDVRRRQQPMRRVMFEACLDSAVPGAPRQVRERAAAVLQVLYSSASWDLLRSFWDMDATAAADAIELGIRSLLSGLRLHVHEQSHQRSRGITPSPRGGTVTHSATTNRRAARTADGEGEAYWFYGDRAIVRSPGGALPIIIEHHVGPGAAAPLHVHHDVDDSFYLLSGQLAMRCADDTFVASAGDYVSLPKGVPHALSNVGDQEAVLLQTHDADSFLTFIRRVGIPGDQPRPDPASLDYAAMNNVAGETGQPVLGPPMPEEEAQAIIARGR